MERGELDHLMDLELRLLICFNIVTALHDIVWEGPQKPQRRDWPHRGDVLSPCGL